MSYSDYALKGFLTCFSLVRWFFTILAFILVSPFALLGYVRSEIEKLIAGV